MLRTELFRTLDRDATRFIAVRDTITLPCSTITVQDMDAKHCRQGRLGIGWHYLILIDGTVETGRSETTCGSHSKDLDRVSVAVALVGGLNEAGARANTRTPEQLKTLAGLIKRLQIRYPEAEVHDNSTPSMI